LTKNCVSLTIIKIKTKKELKLDPTGKYQVVQHAVEVHKAEKTTGYSLFAQASGLGLSMSLPMVLLTVGGLVVDRQLGSKPTLTIVGLLTGTGIGTYNLFRFLKQNKLN
jgi:F0F1-type ATP synthase assembly protein I